MFYYSIGSKMLGDTKIMSPKITDAIFFLTLFAMMCSVTSDLETSGLYPVYSADFFATPIQSAQPAIRHQIQKRVVGSRDGATQPETLVCNDLDGQTTWACKCFGCLHDDYESPPCCTTIVDHVTLNQSVVLVIANLTYSYINETNIKHSVSELLSKYCEQSRKECLSVLGDGTAGLPLYDQTEPLFKEDHVVFIEVANNPPGFDPDVLPMSITFFVLGYNNAPIPGYLVLAALSRDNDVIQRLIGRDVLTVMAATSTTVTDGDQNELPVKAIVAGSVLGFFLALSCIISAVKAVRDRRLIKERNLAKRERRRQKELRDSIRRSPLKQKLEEYAGKSQKESTASNGDVRKPSVTSQMVHVVVHNSGESLNRCISPNEKASANGRVSPNGMLSSNGEPAFSEMAPTYNAVITHGEVHLPPNNPRTDDVSNGSCNSDGKKPFAEPDASDDYLQMAAQDKPDETVAPSMGEFENKSLASLHSNADPEVTIANPRLNGNDVAERTLDLCDPSAENPDATIQKQRPGLVNPAYDGE